VHFQTVIFFAKPANKRY